MTDTPEQFSWVAIDKKGYPYAFITDDISDGFPPSMSEADRKKQNTSWRREVAKFVAEAIRDGDDVRKVGGEELRRLLAQHIAPVEAQIASPPMRIPAHAVCPAHAGMNRLPSHAHTRARR